MRPDRDATCDWDCQLPDGHAGDCHNVRFVLGPWETHYGHDVTGYPCFFVHGLSGDQKRDGDLLEATSQLIRTSPELYVALGNLIKIIDKAGLLNLSNGVQLGQTSWYAKASERLAYAKQVFDRAHPQTRRDASTEVSVTPAASEAK